ncbi:MAG TPA: hypothetical protein VJS66_05200 [Burkholderiales bacterium]|nr:hypothetical protein [Burkholderiales bacterium]
MTSNNLVRVREPWKLEKEEKARTHYLSPAQDPLTISYFDVLPDIKADIDDLKALRDFYRRFAESCGVALIEAELCRLDGLKAIRSIVKSQQPVIGSMYIGGYTLPFHDCSIVLRAQCMEKANDKVGAREAAVKQRYAGRPDWEEDPYDPRYRGKYMRNQSDDVRYDADFPDHSLSKMRRYLAELPQQLDIDPAVKTLRPFVYDPNRVPPKPWWKFWG